MEQLNMMDVPFLVNSRNGSINNMTLVGVLRGEVEAPPHFKGITLRDRNDRFAMMDLVGVVTQSGKYYARGQVMLVVHKSVLNLAKKKDSGRLALAVTGGALRINNRGGVVNFITMMRWSKGQHNAWQVGRVDNVTFNKESFPEFFLVVSEAYKKNWVFNYPAEISEGYTDACDGFQFKLVDTTSREPVKIVQDPPKQPSQPTVPHVANVAKVSAEPSISSDLFNNSNILNLGTSDSSNIATLVNNRAVTHAEVKDKSKFAVVNREKLAPYAKNAKIVTLAIEEADAKINAIFEDMDVYSYAKEENSHLFTDAITFTAERLKTSWNRKVGYSTGRALFKEALEGVLPSHAIKVGVAPSPIDAMLDVLDTRMVDEWLTPSNDFPDNKLIEDMGDNRTLIYIRMMEILLNCKGRLTEAFYYADKANINLLALIEKNPYALCFLDPRLEVEELDKLAMMHGVDIHSDAVRSTRNVAYMHNYMLNPYNRIVGDNTILKYNHLISNIASGYIISKRTHANLQAEGVALYDERIMSLQYYIKETVERADFILPQNNWRPQGIKLFHQIKQSNTEVLQDYLDSGLGVTLTLNKEEYVMDFLYAKKEMYIYNKLRDMASYPQELKLTPGQIAKTVEDFEDIKAKELGLPKGSFKLEQRQAQAVGLLENPVVCLTGPAGSGKTTTAEALVYGAERLLGIDEDSIMFCAPTGKAANRLKEVVKRKTKTINSLFGIGGEAFSLKDEDSIRVKEDIKLLIMDETSMPNIHLMYEVLLRLEVGTRVIFLGDIEQLPPIGVGKPFANMLSFLPTVVLNVTKRASSTSTITRNAEKIIYESDGVIEDLQTGEDFQIVQDKDVASVVNKTLNIVNYHLGKTDAKDFTPIGSLGQDMHPDDIQVITPINKHEWGTAALNKSLQNIFNPRQASIPYINYFRTTNDQVEFRIGDRVTHIKSNNAERMRLQHLDGPSFILETSKGINNGEVGKVIGFYRASQLDFSREMSETNQRDLEAYYSGTETTLYLGVEYKDVDERTLETFNFTILYRMEMTYNSGLQVDVISSDLNYLDLAYALTVHKLQGSEAKLTLIIMLPVGRDFLSRNMIYTAESRGKKGCYMLGDIVGRNSCVNLGRRISATEKRASLIDTFEIE